MAGSERGEILKNEGNNLHQQGKYRAAYAKYSEAIKENPKSAIYYANRAATSLALKEYLDAASDAKKATKLDSKYSKAWGRLGTATTGLGSWDKSIDAWKEALATLPDADGKCTDVEKRMKVQFLEGLKKAENGLEEAKKPLGKVFQSEDKATPWQRAKLVMERSRAEGKVSSALVISYAHKEFMAGVETMRLLKTETAPDGRSKRWHGKPAALVELTNGLIRDLRAFHLDHKDWFSQYNSQVAFECDHWGGWNEGGAKVVKEQAPKRLLREGWQKTRPALAMTVRGWMMCGFFSTASQQSEAAAEFHSRVVDILDWGSRKWHNVPRGDRGVIFERSFIRGAKRSLINAVHEALSCKIECSYTREQLAEMCRDIIADADVHPPEANAPLDPGFYLSFWVYPKADALACLGWYHTHLGLEAEDADSASLEFDQAAKYYAEAGTILPEDEEKALLYLRSAVEAHWYNNHSPQVYMPFVVKIMKSEEAMREIWENSPISESRDSSILQVLEFGVLLADNLKAGKYTKDDIIKPHAIKELDKFPSPNTIYL